MIVLKSSEELDILLNKLRKENKKIGFVATMGALHDGHISLIERSKKENDTTVCSIFVNPLQFNDLNDLEKYPRPIEKDILKLTDANTNILFLPSYEDIYPPNYINPEIDLNGIDTILEGAMRPGHFKGVAQVVKRLFDCVKPDKAYFGQKDYQQILIIKQIVKQFNFTIEVVICDILREKNGLAMSSRNSRLTKEQQNTAGFIYEALVKLKSDSETMPLADALLIANERILKYKGATIEYLTVVDPNTLMPIERISHNNEGLILVVVNYFGVRLLDNMYL